MLNHVESSQSGFAQQKGLTFSMTLAPDLPQYILADEMRLRQVLNNLLHNAIKFTAQGHVRLSVETVAAVESLSGPGLRFEVEDTGVGIPPDKIDAIFQRFTQADGSMTRRFGGTGLGTTIAKQLVELMGGQMGVESTPGEGSRFWFTIPLTLPSKTPTSEMKKKPVHLASKSKATPGSPPACRGLSRQSGGGPHVPGGFGIPGGRGRQWGRSPGGPAIRRSMT